MRQTKLKLENRFHHDWVLSGRKLVHLVEKHVHKQSRSRKGGREIGEGGSSQCGGSLGHRLAVHICAVFVQIRTRLFHVLTTEDGLLDFWTLLLFPAGDESVSDLV